MKQAPLQTLSQTLTHALEAAFKKADLPLSHAILQPSNRPDLSDYQCISALTLSKACQEKPLDIAARIVKHLNDPQLFDSITIDGPGFINLKLTDTFLHHMTMDLLKDPRCGVPQTATPETIVLDYGGMNIAKAMHVGHLRSSIIGESLKRLLRFLDHRIIGDIHLGDWGRPMGLLITEIRHQSPDLPYFTDGFKGPFPKTSPVTAEDLERLYPLASQKAKEDEGYLSQAREATQLLQAGHPGYRALWQHFEDVSIATLKPALEKLGVTFDLWYGESTAHERIAPLVDSLRAKGFVEFSDGAEVISVVRPDDTKEMPPLILIKSDGAVMYGTTDLATIADRVAEFKPHRILYVVDQRQHLHFEQVFRAADKTGIYPLSQLEHLGFGTINGSDGKPFKTRDGGVMKLTDLMDMAQKTAHEKLQTAGLGESYSAPEQAQIAQRIGLAAVKFADLQTNRVSDYIFDLDRFMSFEGKTGPYLLYTLVRMKAITAKAATQGLKLPAKIAEIADPLSKIERELSLKLHDLPRVLELSAQKRLPHIMADHTHQLAQLFNTFYHDCPILAEKDPARQTLRLRLLNLTTIQLSLLLDLLNLDPVERM